MSAQPEALRLAEDLEIDYFGDVVAHDAAAELRRLHTENERLHQINQSHEMKLSVRGYEIQIADLEAQRDALLEALKEITPSMPPVDAPCHYGIVPQEKCGHCGRIAKARAAIKAVEEEA